MEKRNISISLEIAREWYKEGGTKRELVLQAFSKEELESNRVPKSWGEFCKDYPLQKKECWIDRDSSVSSVNLTCLYTREIWQDRNLLPNEEYAKAMRALCQLITLRECWLKELAPDWKPDWISNDYESIVFGWYNSFTVHKEERSRVFSFPTKEMAEDFLCCFKDLFEQAKILI